MTITSLDTTACNGTEVRAEASEERVPLAALPKMVWLGAGLFTANLIIGFALSITPSLSTDPYGREVQGYDSASAKMSPFTQVVDTSRHKVKLAAKARPVTFVPAAEDLSAYESASLDLPRSTPSQLDLPRASSRQLDIPRVSRAYQELDIPVRTERAVYRPGEQGSSANVYGNGRSYDMPKRSERPVDVTPRRTTEKDLVVIN